MAAGEVSGFLRAARSAAMGASLDVAFGPGWPMASLGGGVFVVVGLNDEDPADRIAALRAEIARRSAERRSGSGDDAVPITVTVGVIKTP